MHDVKVKNFDFRSTNSRYFLTRDDKFVYDHFNVGYGQATIAAGLINDRLYYGISLCAPADNFSKKFGRKLATDALIDNKRNHMRGVFKVNDDIGRSHPSVVLKKAVENHIKKMHHKPHWVGEVKFRNGEKK